MALTLVESVAVQAKRLNEENKDELILMLLEELTTQQLHDIREDVVAMIEEQ
jgi:hypothetical protein